MRLSSFKDVCCSLLFCVGNVWKCIKPSLPSNLHNLTRKYHDTQHAHIITCNHTLYIHNMYVCEILYIYINYIIYKWHRHSRVHFWVNKLLRFWGPSLSLIAVYCVYMFQLINVATGSRNEGARNLEQKARPTKGIQRYPKVQWKRALLYASRMRPTSFTCDPSESRLFGLAVGLGLARGLAAGPHAFQAGDQQFINIHLYRRSPSSTMSWKTLAKVQLVETQ